MSTQNPTSDHSPFQHLPINLGNFGGDTVSNVSYLSVLHTQYTKKFKRSQVIFERHFSEIRTSVAWPIQWCEILSFRNCISSHLINISHRVCLSRLIQQKIIGHTLFAQIINRECKVLDCHVCTVWSHFHTACQTVL